MRTTEAAGADPLPTGLLAEWTPGDALSEELSARIASWYVKYHGQGDLDLAPFVSFWLEHRPAAIKYYRRHVETIGGYPDALPLGAIFLLHVHTYTVMGNARGALYELIGAREVGATKAEVLDALELGYLHAGPYGMGEIAAAADDYLRGWTAPDEEVTTIDWPTAWTRQADAFRAGVDPATLGLSAAEQAAVQAWYEQAMGEVPPGVTLMLRHHPDGLKAFRVRLERVAGQHLQIQMIGLCLLHVAAIRGNAAGVRRGVRLALHLGANRREIVHVLLLAGVYLGEGIGDVLGGPAVAELLT